MENQQHILTLYIAGKTRKAERAIENINKYCEEHLQDKYSLEVVDLNEHPELGAGHQVVAIPTLIKKLPEPMRILVGDLSDKEKVLVGLNIKQA